MNLLSRYVLREAFFACLLVTCVVFAIVMSSQFAELLGDAAADELPTEAVFYVFGLTALQALAFIAPFASFLGIMFALARFNRDAETSALLACGFGPQQMLVPIGLLVIALAAAVAWLTIVATPNANRGIERIKFDAEAELELAGIEAGRFVAPDAGGTVFYAERVEGEDIYDVFWARETDEAVTVILAERGRRIKNALTGELMFVLYNGTRHQGIPGERHFDVVEFAEHGLPVRLGNRNEFVDTIEMRPTTRLWRSSDPLDRAELQWRLSAPLSLILLGVLAVPLSRSSPREGRYARIGAGLLIYVTYINLLSIARVSVERSEVPHWIGLWGVHAGLALITFFLFGRYAGWFVSARTVAARAAT